MSRRRNVIIIIIHRHFIGKIQRRLTQLPLTPPLRNRRRAPIDPRDPRRICREFDADEIYARRNRSCKTVCVTASLSLSLGGTSLRHSPAPFVNSDLACVTERARARVCDFSAWTRFPPPLLLVDLSTEDSRGSRPRRGRSVVDSSPPVSSLRGVAAGKCVSLGLYRTLAVHACLM